jgi:hypothetical protein
MNKYFIQLFLKENTVILPGFGALALLNDKLSEIVFLPDLKTDDGKLASYISETEGVDPQDAQNTIARFIREIEFNLNKGESFDIFEFGSFTKNENGVVEFTSWMKDREVSPIENSKESEVVESALEEVYKEGVSASVSIPELVEPLMKNEKKEDKMDSLALIRALLNDDVEEKQVSNIENIALGVEKKKSNLK